MIKSYSGEIRLNNLNLPANKPFQIKLVWAES
jgi:hypothetical protein